MHAYHKQIVIAQFCKFAGVHARMDCDLLANGIVVPYRDAADCIVRAQAKQLRPAPDYAVRTKPVAFADFYRLANNNVGLKNGTFADCGTAVDIAVGSDNDVIG